MIAIDTIALVAGLLLLLVPVALVAYLASKDNLSW